MRKKPVAVDDLHRWIFFYHAPDYFNMLPEAVLRLASKLVASPDRKNKVNILGIKAVIKKKKK